MGMFDYITVSCGLLPKPLRRKRQDQGFQTKSLENKCDWYRITKEGLLFRTWRSFHHEYGGDLSVNEFIDFTGTIEFYDYYEHHRFYGWHTFKAQFEHGKLVGIIEEVFDAN